MPYLTDHKQKFDDLRFYLDHQDQLRKQANGGNSILFSYQPDEEHLYVEEAKERYGDQASFIDISKLFVKFIEEDGGWESFKEYYNDFRDTPHKIFHSDEDSSDLFDHIVEAIQVAANDDKIPFLIRTGCLYGTGIENVNIMEHPSVMKQTPPLVIFYPSRFEDDNIYFLNFKPASKYRCILVK